MANRGNMSSFGGSFSRRPTSGAQPPSILGDPPVARRPQNFSNYGGGSGGNELGYTRRGEAPSNYDYEDDEYSHRGSGNREDGRSGSGYQNVTFVHNNQGGRAREQEFSGNRAREISPWTTNSDRSPNRRQDNYNRDDDRRRPPQNPAWNSGRPFESPFKNNQGVSLGMGLGQNVSDRQGNQPVVMVVPQGQAGAAGMQSIMGMMPLAPAGQNPFNVLQRQAPMQVILGNLPAFNSDSFGQQLLTAATNAQFGLGGGQQFNRQAFDDGSDRSRISRQRSGQGSGTTSVRRTGSDSNRNFVLRNGRSGTSNSDLQRGRKRGYSERQSDVDNKRTKPGQSGSSNKDKVARTSLASSSPRKNQQSKKTSDTASKTKSAEAGSAEAKPETVKEGAEGKDEEMKDSEAKDDEAVKEAVVEEKPKKKSKYEGLPVELFVCKICQKGMNDASAFESHLSGRPHQSLARILDQRFKKRVDVLMTDSKLNEDEIALEIERQRRAGKQNIKQNKNKNFCKMCDCNYALNWGEHKISLGHRVLKEFLHPSCRLCEVNFVNRLDWVNHLTDATHLKKVLALKEEGRELTEEMSTAPNQLFSISLELSKDDNVGNCITIRNANWKIPSKDELAFILESDARGLVAEDEEIIVPKVHDDSVSYGTNAISDVNGFSCKVCRTFIVSEKEVEMHCKSKSHFGMYSGFLRKLAKQREQVKLEKEKKEQAEKDAAAAALEAEKLKSEEAQSSEIKAEEKPEIVDLESEQNENEESMEVNDEKIEINGDHKTEDEIIEGDDEEVLEDKITASEIEMLKSPEESIPLASPEKDASSQASTVTLSPVKKVIEENDKVVSPQKVETGKQALTTPAPTPTAGRGATNNRARCSRPGRGGGALPGRGQPMNRGTPTATPRGRGQANSPRGGNSARGGARGGNWERSRGRGRAMHR